MIRQTSGPLTYVIVCAALVLLTVLTVALSFASMHGTTHIVSGLLIAVVKAALVVLFFMHVLHSPKLTWAVIIVAVFWLGILFVLTLNDYYTRGMVNNMQGH